MNKSCKERVKEHFKSRFLDLKTLWNAEDNETEELGSLNEYALSFDFVEAGTFEGQRADYYRYQISWGGPCEEFRIYKNGDVEFWLLDWGDGAKIDLTEEQAALIRDIIAFDCLSWTNEKYY